MFNVANLWISGPVLLLEQILAELLMYTNDDSKLLSEQIYFGQNMPNFSPNRV